MAYLKDGNVTVHKLLHDGQTGVARGAFLASQVIPLVKATGVMPKEMNDEKGIIPVEVRDGMWASDGRLHTQQVKELVLLSSCVLVVVPNRLSIASAPEVDHVLDYAATRPGLQVMVATRGDADAVHHWLCHLPPYVSKQSGSRDGTFKLYVSGPRASVWPEGEQVTLDLLVGALK